VQAGNNGGSMAILLAIGALLLTWFFIHVRARERAGKEPLLPTALFRHHISLALVTQNIQWPPLMGTAFVVSALRSYAATMRSKPM
jgi:hypothetical protein